jgi:dolichol-phosphate mannosyltransferase
VPQPQDVDVPASADEATLPKTLVAIPVHNEADHARRLIPTLRNLPYDRLLVDDGSTDGSGDVLDEAERRDDCFVLRHDTNRGYGAALINAFDWAHARGYEWVITMDCDEQHDPANLPAFARAIARDDLDLVSGSRYLRAFDDDEEDLPPPERRAVNLIITATLNELFGWSVTDAFCGFKAHRVGATVALDLDEAGYAFPLQLWPRVHAAGLRVGEIPVKRIYNDPNRSFGHDVRVGDLDDARNRLGHYLSVLRDELCGLGLPPLRDAVPAVARSAIDRLPTGRDGGLRESLRAGYVDAANKPCW